MECSVRGVTSILSFSVASNPRLLTLQRTELSHATKQNKIVWVPFDIKKMRLSRQETSYEDEDDEENPKDIYKYLNLNLYKSSHNRRENKRIFNAEMFQPVTMALVSKSPSSSSFHPSSLILIFYLIKIF